MAVSAYAQSEPPAGALAPPANLSFIDGSVNVTVDGVTSHAEPPVLLIDGDAVHTLYGRAEIVFADGTLAHLDRDTDLDILSSTRLRLLAGRAIVRVSAAAARPYAIDTVAGIVGLDPRGEYSVTTSRERGLDVAVTRGTATIDDGGQQVRVRAGENVSLERVGDRAVFKTFNSARWDSFTQWANERTNGFTTSASASQLPSELRPYSEDFDENGHWDYLAPYGNIWYPTVAVGWRPYYDGSWGHTRYGWTWFGRNCWGWATHHFGRWGYNGNWFWIPTNVWGPGWVSWGLTSGYVSWSPLGFDGQPALPFNSRATHPAYAPSRAWTIAPRNQFGVRGRAVRAYAVDGNLLNDATRGAMVFQNVGPAVAGGYVRTRPALPDESRQFPGNLRRPAAVDSRPVDRPGADRPGNVRAPAAAPRPSDALPGSSVAPTRRVERVPEPTVVERPVPADGTASRETTTHVGDFGVIEYRPRNYGTPTERDSRTRAGSETAGRSGQSDRSQVDAAQGDRGRRDGEGSAGQGDRAGSAAGRPPSAGGDDRTGRDRPGSVRDPGARGEGNRGGQQKEGGGSVRTTGGAATGAASGATTSGSHGGSVRGRPRE